jgi:hypothetical protein
MNKLTSITNKTKAAWTDFTSDPVTTFVKENWREIAAVAAVALIVEDVDTAADMAETSLTLDILTAVNEGVIS